MRAGPVVASVAGLYAWQQLVWLSGVEEVGATAVLVVVWLVSYGVGALVLALAAVSARSPRVSVLP